MIKPKVPRRSVRMSRLWATLIMNVVVLLYKFTIYVQVFERNVFCAFDVISVISDVIKATIFYADVGNMFVIVQTNDKYTQLTLLASHVFEVYIADDRREAAVALFAVFVLQVDAQYSFAALPHGDVAYKYVFNDSTPASTGLDADNAIQVGAVHLAVLYI